MTIELLKRALRAQGDAPAITDPAQVQRDYRHWRIRTMYGLVIGYAAFYLVRKNFSMAMPAFLGELHYTKTDLGLMLSLFSALYGVGKFLNGILADRANPRYFMTAGLIGAAVMNVCFGFSTALWTLGLFWLGNAWFQSMGWPPCARMLTHWYSPRERGSMWGLWNASHQIGGAAIMVGAGYLISTFGWRSAFYVPALIVIALSFVVMNRLRDTPASLGLPPVEEFRGEARPGALPHRTGDTTVREILVDLVLRNRHIWYLCLANFFVYIVRIGVLDWAPTFLVEVKGSSLGTSGLEVAGFEIAGIFGALLAGWSSDRVFKGRRGPPSVLFMGAVVFFLVYLWKIPAGHPWLDATALVAVGFLVYGPQMLVGVAAADCATSKAAATATGLTGAFGYLGSTVCGLGTGLIVDRWGWDGGFLFFIASALLGVLFFLLTWRARSPALDALHAPVTGAARGT